jgi:hypothetical protein
MRSIGEELEWNMNELLELADSAKYKGSANVKSNTPPYIHQILVKRVKGQRQRVGVLVGRIDSDNKIKIGWSRTNVSKDKFDKNYGLNLAIMRTYAQNTVPVPQSIIKDIVKFRDRCRRYFKGGKGLYSGTDAITVQPQRTRLTVQS